eukprot:CAMPEP_0168463352 /NCGR_PEP_ID=MMETSP0228-20121227/55009_1 /TAXON_ID=133427 /ORGANISM="Protoceratium reticulatum, Strain CCCM 535 (=CCMP 1889)" /LENGTH=668 /DNA_ID=CAMNT_0008478801 /DNA_START=17 /DNA_END=2023 /DNA_ORIENTATION=+
MVAGKAAKDRRVEPGAKVERPVARRTLRTALVMQMRQQEQASRGTKVDGASSKKVSQMAGEIPITERAGAPLVPTKVKPADWKTLNGKKITVDLARVQWLPDDWGQGVKMTNPISRSRAGYGGTYTVWVSPEGRVFYHRWAIEDMLGRKLTARDGFNGQMRLARLQGKLTDEAQFFKILSAKERAKLPSKDEFHFCVISARRTQTAEGLNDIALVQSQIEAAGVTPTWYVDEPSLEEYKKLGLKAVVGGKLTQARNMALKDAHRLGKCCVQVSDDIRRWEYRDGAQAEDRSDEAANKAFAASTCHVISPVSAARFMVAKMRAMPGERPRLAGVYPLATCSRSFGGEEFSGRHFILGDFFVVDHSPVRFDEQMTLKEDYSFTCMHIEAHGSVLRCNRMTVDAKHQSNAGGACSNRDKKGLEEQKNIDILFRRWPHAFRNHPKRKLEVVLCWPLGGGKDGKCKAPGKAGPVAASLSKGLPVKKDLKLKGTRPGMAAALRAKLRRAAERALGVRAKTGRELLEAPAHWPEGAHPDPSVNVPWLPHGWQAAINHTRTGTLRRCFINPDGKRFHHKAEVKEFLRKSLARRVGAKRRGQGGGRQGSAEDVRLASGDLEWASEYIGQRCMLAAGRTVREALDRVEYRDKNGNKKKYNANDLSYDLKCGYLYFVVP